MDGMVEWKGKSINNVHLTSTAKISDYLSFRDERDVKSIAKLILDRFSERYIGPFDKNPYKHGFAMMAVSCLMIESLIAFGRGWDVTPRKKAAKEFELFFANSKAMKVFRGWGAAFYTDVRCGLLHQAETYNGWIIVRRGPIFTPATKTINATKFLLGLKAHLHTYRGDIQRLGTGSTMYKNAIQKLDYICDKCA